MDHFWQNIVPLTAVILIFGGGAVQHLAKGIRAYIEAKAAQQNGVNEQTAHALAELRREIAALRETSTQFDMSFDAAITRLEQRVDRVEGLDIPAGMVAVRTAPMPAYVTQTTAPQEVTLSAGRGV